MKLFQELSEEVEYITEGKDGEKNFYVSGVFMQGDVKNGNGRIYPINTLSKAVDKYNEEFVSRRRALGELGHPATPSLNYDRASHLITELKRDGKNIVGKAKVLDTPMGNIVKSLMKENCQLGISSRGLGSIKEDRGQKIVQDDLTLVTAGDLVHTPSAPDAFLENLMEQACEWVFTDGEWRKAEKLQESIKKIKNIPNKEQREKLFIEQFENFVTNLKV